MLSTKFKVGDIVLAYYKGLWRIKEINKRKEYTPLVTLTKVATHRISPCKPIEKICDVAWCRYPLDTTIEYAKMNGVQL